MIVRFADRIDHEVREFEHGGSLCGALDAGYRPDVILLDVLMPEMDGIETITRLEGRDPPCGLILVTGGETVLANAARHIAESTGQDLRAVLAKPVSLDELEAVLAG